jgi:hypothetical protein
MTGISANCHTATRCVTSESACGIDSDVQAQNVTKRLPSDSNPEFWTVEGDEQLIQDWFVIATQWKLSKRQWATQSDGDLTNQVSGTREKVDAMVGGMSRRGQAILRPRGNAFRFSDLPGIQ